MAYISEIDTVATCDSEGYLETFSAISTGSSIRTELTLGISGLNYILNIIS